MKTIKFKSYTFGNVEINLTEAMSGKPVLITEEIASGDVERIKKIINSHLKDNIDDMVTKIVKRELNSSATEDMIVTITANCLTQLYKALWSRRGFWKSAIANKPN